MNFILEVVITGLAAINLLIARFALLRLHQPTTLPWWMIKVSVSALSPVLFLVGILTGVLGWRVNAWPAVVLGGVSALLYLIHIVRISGIPGASSGFDKLFGKQFEDRIPRERLSRFLSKRYVVWLPHTPEPVFTQNVVFHTISDTNRQLLCDVWQPPGNVKRSGLAFIYLHGSAWTVLDKDYGTRTFFRHLAAQGHVIMDVAYRLFPETGFMGMVHDAKHAIAWLKANAESYDVNPDRIVVGGGSAGAHIALLAAYTAQNKQFTPADLEAADLHVHGVISLYGPADLETTFYHTCQHLTTHSALAESKTGGPGGMPPWMQKRMGDDFHRLGFDKGVEPGMLVPMLGGIPDEKPEAYALYSPVTHAHEGCPPTLLIHGEHDILAPLEASRRLYSLLVAAGVPAALHILPQTDHAFDLILPRISPSAQNGYFDVERFLALRV